MKHLLFTLAASAITFSAAAQITLTSPAPVRPNVLDSFTLPLSIASLPSMGPSSGGSWDLDSIGIQAVLHTAVYSPATRSFTTASFSSPIRCTLIGGITPVGYTSWNNFRQTARGVDVPGEDILTRQSFGLGTSTGNILDSITFPIQAITYNNALPVIEYPARLGNSWSATASRNVAFNLTVAAAGLNNTPAQHRQVRRVLDSVVGWGRMSVVGSSRVDLQACKLEYSIVSPK